MPAKAVSQADIRAAAKAYQQHGSKAAAAKSLGIPVTTFKDRLAKSDTDPMDRGTEDAFRLERQLLKEKADHKVTREKLTIATRELTAAEKRAEVLMTLDSGPNPRPVKRRKPRPGRSEAMLVLTDWHVEKTVKPGVVGGRNEYSLRIAGERVKRCLDRAARMIEVNRQFADIDTLHLAFLGDFIDGHIHDENKSNNGCSPIEALLHAQDLLATVIDFFLEQGWTDIRIPCCHGNHGRATARMTYADPARDSYEWLMYQHLARTYEKDSRVKFDISEGYVLIHEFAGHKVRLHHGQGLKYSGGVGGLAMPAKRWIGKRNSFEPVLIDIFGHFHHCIWDPQFIACGSLLGVDGYADAFALGGEPSQTLIMASESRGVWQAMPVFVD